MSLFGNREQKQKEQPACCCCGGDEPAAEPAERAGEGASVKILGGGCPKCNALEAATVAALERLGMDTSIDHVKDYTEIAKYGVMSTPALVVDGKVLSYGKVLKTDEVAELIKKVR